MTGSGQRNFDTGYGCLYTPEVNFMKLSRQR
jgi:hypothetical protein